MALTKIGIDAISGAIGTTQITDGAVTSAKIANNTITSSDLASGAVSPTAVSDQANSSTGYFDVPSGTTAQRPVSPNVGMVRFNTDTSCLEQYTSLGWLGIAAPPTITSVSPSTFTGDQGTTFTINGTSFDAAPAIKFIDNAGVEYTAASVSRISTSQLTATTPQDFTVAQEPLKVKVTNSSGLTYTLDNAIDCGGVPNWVTSAGSLGVANERSAISFTVSATDPESGAVTYSAETSLPSGITIGSSTGVISGTTPDVAADTTYNFTLGATDVGSNKTTRAFSYTSYVGDDNWKNTLLLAKGVGAGAQNSIVDSANAQTFTPNGNIHQSSFSPYNSGWSTYFDHQLSAYLSVADSGSNFDFGSGDFTIESWCFVNSWKNSFPRPWGFAVEGTPTGSGIGLFYGTDNNGQTVYIRSQTAGDTAVTINSPTAQWFHLALVRQGGTIRLYQNGIQVGTQSVSGAMYYNNRFRIGASNTTSPTEYWDGYISNMRIVKGTCLYNNGTTFTPPTSDLTAVSGTVLLTCQDNRVKDNSSANNTITLVGAPQTFPFNPYGNSSVVGGSYALDGTGDFATTPDNDSYYNFGTGNFTIECWAYPTNTVGTGSSCIFNQSSSGASSDSSVFFGFGGGGGGVYISPGTTWTYDASFAAPTTNRYRNGWHHVVGQRNGTDLSFWIDGTKVASATLPSNYAIGNSSRTIEFGSQASGNHFAGYVSDLRVVKGTALYSGSTYTVPTAPLTAVSGTTLLLKGSNAKVTDLAGNFNLQDSGNAAGSTSQIKYGSGSMVFDGNGDYFTVGDRSGYPAYNAINWLNTQTTTRTGTLEAWVYLRSVQVSPGQTYLFRSILSRGDTFLNWGVNASLQPVWYWYGNPSGNQNTLTSSGTITLNTWTHLAITISGTTATHWINGVAAGSGTFSGIMFGNPGRDGASGDMLNIGMVPGQSTSSWDGYIDELRITPGIVRYSSTFTPPTRFLSYFKN